MQESVYILITLEFGRQAGKTIMKIS